MELTRHALNTDFAWRGAKGPFALIDDAQARQWNQSGYLLLKNVFADSELRAVAGAIDPLEQANNAFLRTVKNRRQYIARADEVTFALHVVLHSAAAQAFARHPVFGKLCLDLLGPDCRLYWDQAVYKKAHCPEEFPWHQDNGYNFVHPQDYLTCWVPLTDTTVANGCPWVMPGVHRTGTIEHWHTDLGWQCLQGMDDAVAVEANAGDVVVFSSLTPHRTGPNHTAQERKAYILQYCHDGSVRLADEQRQLQNHSERQFSVVSNGLLLSST